VDRASAFWLTAKNAVAFLTSENRLIAELQMIDAAMIGWLDTEFIYQNQPAVSERQGG